MNPIIVPTYKKIKPFNRCVIQNFPFIEQDFDALSNYGLMSKIVEYLNIVIESQNQVMNQVTMLSDFIYNLNLHDYVDQVLKEYIDNGTFYETLAYNSADQSLTLTFDIARS